MIKQGKITEGIYTSRLNDSKSLSKKDVIYNQGRIYASLI